jgi:aminobenzoyl-glutamate utilization protein B
VARPAASQSSLADRVAGDAGALSGLADQVWDWAELRFEEVRSSALLADALEARGFAVTRNVADLPTAFVATRGSGSPVIGFLGEYDALPGLGEGGTTGHGCGHHALGTASLGAALALADHLAAAGLPGTVKYFGCPAEEGGSGKTFLVRAGLFAGVDAVLAWHPGDVTEVYTGGTLANIQVGFTFRGTTAHAALAPHRGRSALDAVELMNVGANYLREHIPPGALFHYAVTDAGGTFPNVVPDHASVLYLVRATAIETAREVMDRITDVARGAALMTGTQVDVQFDRATSALVPSAVLSRLVSRVLADVGPLASEPADLVLAQKLALTPPGAPAVAVEPLPLVENAPSLPFSTDVGDVSQVVPTCQFTGCCFVRGTTEHTWQMVAQGKEALAHRGIAYAARVMAEAGWSLVNDPALVAEAQAEHRLQTGGRPYECPIPADVRPGKRTFSR